MVLNNDGCGGKPSSWVNASPPPDERGPLGLHLKTTGGGSTVEWKLEWDVMTPLVSWMFSLSASALCVQEMRDRPGTGEMKATGENLSYGERGAGGDVGGGGLRNGTLFNMLWK
ncbi:unnamed protein product [Pleuronectes platessa]|uniref:Uncharacterized protein n=1 Tax=Pleuronectes platessa TaxID=8262 RepID=A0A9N7V6J8_PLEPL|nr:unnamed protein product [Pleuronectes platessa]